MVYIDGTFISTKDFYQLIIFMYYDESSKKKYLESTIKLIKKVFIGIRQVGCYFHFIKNNRLKMSKLGLFSSKYSEYGNNILKDISLLPFNYDSNKNIIEDIFKDYKSNLDPENSEKEVLLNLVKKYEKYFF